jgi:hypothetical protein
VAHLSKRKLNEFAAGDLIVRVADTRAGGAGPAAAQTAMETFTLKMVSDWMDNTGRHATRLTWWLGTSPNTMLYTKIASLLLSGHAHDRQASPSR